MFGGLFDEEETGDDLQTQFSRMHVASVDSSFYKQRPGRTSKTRAAMLEPPKPRSEVKLCGLDNLGATCYLNSLVQTLLFTPEFRDALFKLKSEHLGNLEDQDKPNSNVRRIPIQLQRLFARLLLGDIVSTTTSDLVTSFGWINDENLMQQDVQELYHTLMSAIENSLVYTPGENIVSETFYGKIINQITCLVCGDVRESMENFLDISVAVTRNGCLEDGLSRAFVEKESMVAGNQYLCSRCGRLVDAKKEARLRNLPPILGFSLLRFTYDVAKLKSLKDKRKFMFPHVLDMASYCDKVLPAEDSKYELFSILIHRGSAQSGHYHVYIKDIDGLGNSPFEEVVSPEVPLVMPKPVAPLLSSPSPRPQSQTSADVKIPLPEEVDLNNPSEIIKYVLSSQPNEMITYADMDKKILEIKGESWESSFRLKHGPLPRFILWSDEFDSSGSGIVFKGNKRKQRKKKPSGDNQPKKDESKSEPVITTVSNGFSDHDLSITKIVESPPPPAQQAPNWYDFNDSNVVPIHSSDIASIFGGEECAYMLFYRCKSLKRPSEAIGNPYYGIPESLSLLIHDENRKFQSQREAYQMSLNAIVINVHMGAHYHFLNGSLSPVNDGQGCVSVNVNKKDTIADFYEAIKLACKLEVGSAFILTCAKPFTAGLHLYENISANSLQQLNATDIKDGSHLFLWDGEKIDGCNEIMRGEIHEPLLLHFNYTDGDGSLLKFSHSFPKSFTFGRVVITVADKLKAAPQRLFLKHGKHCSNLKDETTLVELGIPNSYNLIAEILNSDFDVKLANANQVFLTIKNDSDDGKSFGEEKRVFSIIADITMTIAELRKKTLTFLDLAFTTQCRLSLTKEDFDFPVPLFEEQTVCESRLSAASVIILENGLPPGKEQITLRVLYSDGKNVDLNVSKYISVERFLQKVIRTAYLEGSNWCIKPKMWSGDAGKALANHSLSLHSYQIHHGTSLIVEQKQANQEQTITLTIWFHPTLPCSGDLRLKWESLSGPCDTDFKELMAVCPTQPTQLGELCVPASTKIDDLKKKILALPLLKDVPPIRTAQIRIRMLLDNKPGRVLRGSKKMLKSLKVIDQSHLCVQLLPNDENLSTNAIIVSVMQRLPGERSYLPPVEVIFDCGPSLTVDQFKKVLAAQIGMMAENIHVAKKYVGRCEWVVIGEEHKFFTETHLRHKLSKNVMNNSQGLKVGNVMLYNGDILGVRDLVSSSVSCDDFSTKEDDLIRQHKLINETDGELHNGALTVDCEEKNRQSKVQRTGCNEPIGNKAASHGITIHVGNFSQYTHSN